MKLPKLKIITMAIIFALSQNARAAEEVLPYTLSIKYMNESADALVLIKGESKYISKAELSKLYEKATENAPTILHDDEEFIPLTYLGELSLDNESMSAVLELNPGLMPEQRYSLDKLRYQAPSAPEAGQYLNYDFYSDLKNKQTSLDLSHNFSTSKGSFGQVSGNWNTYNGFSLIDANFNTRDIKNNRIYRFGTGTSLYSEVSNSYRFVGLQVQSDHLLNPYYNDRVSSIFTGTAEVEGTAELFLNGNKILNQQIRPGDFVFDGLHNPMTTTGDATLLIRDASGRLLSYSKPLLGSPKNLRAGYSTYSFEAGYLRTDYNRLGKVFGSGDYSYGLTDRLTLAGHFEATKDAQNISATAIVATGLGTIKGGASVGNGQIYNLGYFLATKEAYANLDYKKYVNQRGIASNEFRDEDVFAFTGAIKVTQKQYINFSALNTSSNRYVSLGSNWMLNGGASLQANVSRDNYSGTTFYVGLNIPLGNTQSNSFYDSKNKMFGSEIKSNRYALNSLDYTARYTNQSGKNYFTGLATLPTQYGDIGADVSIADESAVRLRANGSIVKTAESFSLARKINDSYIIVDAKAPNVGINTSMGYQGKTNADGVLVYPTSALGEHKIFLDNKDFPDEVVPMEDDIKVNPYPKSSKTVEVKMLKQGFMLSVPTEKQSIKINGTTYYRINDSFYVDGLADGEYTFTADGKKYIFNTKQVDINNDIKAQEL